MGDPGILKGLPITRSDKSRDGIGDNSSEVLHFQSRYLYRVIALIGRRHDSPPFEILNGV
ncbi:unannotated protein [freshwater metagenome]|uniref:Unannotated protein n=1 Tax=freshwater metagenome TaxID=449393 RepID=A0A6J7GPZ9_9ZZZZ